MSDTIRVKSNLPLAIRISEPHPDPEKPGDSPPLKQAVIASGVNLFSGDDVKTYKAWAETKPSLLTDGHVTEMKDDEPDQQFGFEPALKAMVSSEMGKSASEGSTLKDAGPVRAEAMRFGEAGPQPLPADAPGQEPPRAAAPAMAATAPIKPPVGAGTK